MQGFPSPLLSKGYSHTDQGKDTTAEIMDAHYQSLVEKKPVCRRHYKPGGHG